MTRQITTVEQLDALPVGTVILSHHGHAWQRVPHRERMSTEGWICADPIYPGIYKGKHVMGAIIYHDEPATVLYEPGEQNPAQNDVPAGQPGEQPRPLPDRDQIARAIYNVLDPQYGDFNMPTDAADAVLALLKGQPQ